MTWRKKFNIDNKGKDDYRPGQRLINYFRLHNSSKHWNNYEAIEHFIWNLTPDEFEHIMNWSPNDQQ